MSVIKEPSSEEMAREVGRVKLTARPDLTGRFTRHHSRAPEAIELLRRRRNLAAQDAADHLQQLRVSGHHDQKPAQVIAQNSLVPVRLGLERRDAEAV